MPHLSSKNPFVPIPALETERLVLRDHRESDAPALQRLYSEPGVREFIDDVPPMDTIEDALAMYDQVREWNRDGYANRWAITLKGQDQLIGTVGYHHLVREHFRVEIGYDLHPDYWRQGMMSEALKAAIPWAFDELGVNRIEAAINAGNLASESLVRSLGFRRDAYMREYEFFGGRFIDLQYFSLLKKDWYGESRMC